MPYGVVVAVVVATTAGLGSKTTTSRNAVPMTPFWSMAKYSMVEVPVTEVSMTIWSMVVVACPEPVEGLAPPFTVALMPRLRSFAGPVIVAPRST